MSRVRTLTLSRRERVVQSWSPLSIRLWAIAAVLFAVTTLRNLLVGDWGDALDGLSLTVAALIIVGLARDVNALMGGHR